MNEVVSLVSKNKNRKKILRRGRRRPYVRSPCIRIPCPESYWLRQPQACVEQVDTRIRLSRIQVFLAPICRAS